MATDVTRQIIKLLREKSITDYRFVANRIEEFGAECGDRLDGNGMAQALAAMCRAVASELEASAAHDGNSGDQVG
jgi:hypothetical protein